MNHCSCECLFQQLKTQGRGTSDAFSMFSSICGFEVCGFLSIQNIIMTVSLSSEKSTLIKKTDSVSVASYTTKTGTCSVDPEVLSEDPAQENMVNMNFRGLG